MTPKNRLLVVLAATALVGESARAGIFEPARSREPLPAREVERPPVVPTGWSQVEAGLGWKSEGTWKQRALVVNLRHGLMRRTEGWLALRHRDHRLGSDRSVGLAVPSFGLRGLVVANEPGGTWLSWEGGAQMPLGADHPNPEVRVPISEPTPAVWLAISLRQRVGGLRVDLGSRGQALLPGPYGFGAAGDGCASPWTAPVGRAAGGGAVDGWLRALLQAGPLLGRGGLEVSAWGPRDLQAARSARSEATTCAFDTTHSGAGRMEAGSAWTGMAGAGAQLSRGVALGADWTLPIGDRGAPRPVDHLAARGFVASVEVSF